MEVGNLPRQPTMADTDLGLDGTGSMDGPDRAVSRRRSVDDRPVPGELSAPSPGTEHALGQLDNVLASQVAGDDERSAARVEASLIRPSQVGRRQALYGLAGAPGRPVIRRLRGVDGRGEGLFGPSARVGLRLQEIVQARKGRPQQDFGDELERGGKPLGGDFDARAKRIPAGVGMERRAQSLRGFNELDRVVPLCPFRQRSRRQDRGAGQLVRFFGGPGTNDDGRGHEWTAGQVRDDNRQAAGQLGRGDGRELVGARCTRTGPLRDDRLFCPGLGPGRHAATSSSSAASLLGSGSAISPADGPSGR